MDLQCKVCKILVDDLDEASCIMWPFQGHCRVEETLALLKHSVLVYSFFNSLQTTQQLQTASYRRDYENYEKLL